MPFAPARHRRRSFRLASVYTSPLNGSGERVCGKASWKTRRSRISRLVPRAGRAGRQFPDLPVSNPEIREAMQKGTRAEPDQARSSHRHRPDCDRCGVAVPDKGSYRRSPVNEVGVLLLRFHLPHAKKLPERFRAPCCRHRLSPPPWRTPSRKPAAQSFAAHSPGFKLHWRTDRSSGTRGAPSAFTLRL